MAFNNQRSNNNGAVARNPQDDTNTNGIMLKNYDAHKFFAGSFWNKSAVLEIGAIPEGAESDYTVIRKVQTIRQVMTFQTLTTLDSICDDVLESLKKTGRFTPAGAPCGASFTNMVEISDGSNLDLPMGIYLVIYKDWDQGRKTNKMDVYPFSSRTVLKSYNHNTGNANEERNAVRDFKDFCLWVHETCKAFTYAQAHSMKEIDKKVGSDTLKYLNAIANSLGVDTSFMGPSALSFGKKSSYNGNKGKGGSGYGSVDYRGGSTGGFNGYRSNNSSSSSQFSGGQSQSAGLDLNITDVKDIPMDQFF